MSDVLLNKHTRVFHVLRGDGYTLCGKEAKKASPLPGWKWVDDHANTCPTCGSIPQIAVDDWEHPCGDDGDGFVDMEIVSEDEAKAFHKNVRLCGSCGRA